MPPEQPLCFGAYRLAGLRGPLWCGAQSGILGASLGGSRGQAGGAGAGGRVRCSARTRRARVTRALGRPPRLTGCATRSSALPPPVATRRGTPSVSQSSGMLQAACFMEWGGAHGHIDQGWIVEDGTPNELRPQSGLYHRLWTRRDTGLEMKGVEATVKTGSVRFIRPLAIHVRILQRIHDLFPFLFVS
jgi:hypothetical protein